MPADQVLSDEERRYQHVAHGKHTEADMYKHAMHNSTDGYISSPVHTAHPSIVPVHVMQKAGTSATSSHSLCCLSPRRSEPTPTPAPETMNHTLPKTSQPPFKRSPHPRQDDHMRQDYLITASTPAINSTCSHRQAATEGGALARQNHGSPPPTTRIRADSTADHLARPCVTTSDHPQIHRRRHPSPY